MTSIPLAPSDFVVVGGYFLLVVWVGVYFRQKIKAPADYFAGGHKVPWWLAGVSHYMSSFSAFSFVAYAQMGYTYGWVAVTLFWVTIPACVMGGLFFARAWRRANVITPVEFLERRFNIALRQVFAWAGLPMKIFEDGLKIFATSIFLALGAGISVPWSIVVCGAVTVLYTVFGGLWALVVTDYVQFIMKALAILLLFPLALWRAGGFVNAFHGLPADFFHLTNGPYNWIYVVGFTALITINYNGSWSLAQKYYSVHTESEASKAAYLAAALNGLGAPIMILPAIIGRHFLPDLIAHGRTADAYAMLVLHLLPHGMVGIIIAAVLSATMATVSADFNSIASVLTQDVYHRLLRPQANNRQLVRVGRVITLLLGSLVVGCALWIYFKSDQQLFHLMVLVAGVFMAPAFLPLLAALTFPKLNWKGALTGFIAGLTSGFIMLTLRFTVVPGVQLAWVKNGFEGISILVNAFFTVVGLYLGTLVFGSTAEDQEKARDFFRKAPRAPEPARGPADRPHEEPIAKMTMAVGVLLGIAGAMVGTWTGRAIDGGVALLLVLLGVSMYRRSRRRRREEISNSSQN